MGYPAGSTEPPRPGERRNISRDAIRWSWCPACLARPGEPCVRRWSKHRPVMYGVHTHPERRRELRRWIAAVLAQNQS